MTLLNDEGRKKVALMRELARKQYDRLTALEDTVSVVDYNPDRDQGEYLQLPYRPQLPISDFNDPTTIMDLVFMEIGRGMAFSETRFLAEELEKAVQSVKVSLTPLNAVLESFFKLSDSGHEPSAVLAPIDYYMDWHDDLMVEAQKAHDSGRDVPFRIENDEEKSYLRFPDGHRLRWVWSNNLSPFRDFYMMDSHWAVWTAKRSEEDNERFQISVTERGDKLDVIFRLLFKLDILYPFKVRRFLPLKGVSKPTRSNP